MARGGACAKIRCAPNVRSALSDRRALSTHPVFLLAEEPARRRPFIAATAGAGPASYTLCASAGTGPAASFNRLRPRPGGSASRGVASDALASFYVAPCTWCGARREASATASFLVFVQEATDSARTVWVCRCRIVVVHARLLSLLAAQARGYHRPQHVMCGADVPQSTHNTT